MQFSFLLLAVLGVADSSTNQTEAKNYHSLQEIYGRLTLRAEAVGLEEQLEFFETAATRTSTRVPARALRGAGASVPLCDGGFDFLILQDATGSFEKDFEVTANSTLPALSEAIAPLAPGSTWSLVTFRDKPLANLGEPTDDCFTVHALRKNDPKALTHAFRSDIATGGRDIPENQFGALLAVSSSPKTIPWHVNSTKIPIIFMITDAVPHFAEDGVAPISGALPPFVGPYDEDKSDEYCRNQNYPSPVTVREALLREHLFLGVAVRRAKEGSAALANWQWFNDFVGYPSGFVQAADDETGWIKQFAHILEKVYEKHCGTMPSTTTTIPARAIVPAETGSFTTKPSLTDFTPEGKDPEEREREITVEEEPADEPLPDCNCPSQPEGPSDPCCHRQPEVLLALMRQPGELDIHFRGYLRTTTEFGVSGSGATTTPV